MRKQILYLGHDYHTKTKSTNFLIQLLLEKYEVDILTYDPYNKEYIGIEKTGGKSYEIFICFQIMPQNIQFCKDLQFHFNKGILFPMYDAVISITEELWEEYREFTIINFSKTLHEMLVRKGYHSYYIQYFPKPAKNFEWGNSRSLFFWQRKKQININTIQRVCEAVSLERIHIHKALDPNEKYIEAEGGISDIITYSEWFDTPQQLFDIMMESAFYMAPRVLEGIGMSFLEAMAMGRCVIAPDFPTMNEYIINSVTGYLYDIRDLKAIDFGNILEVQKNTYAYMQAGYERWQQDKYKILEWMEMPIVSYFKNDEERAQKRINFLLDTINKKDEKIDKFQTYFNLLNSWLRVKNDGKLLTDFFMLNGYKNIAIYGMGEVGNRLYEELRYSDIHVCYAIDSSSIKIHQELKIVSMNEQFPAVDAIVVTPVSEFNSIKARLINKTEISVISIQDVINGISIEQKLN